MPTAKAETSACYAHLEAGLFTIGNALIERRWRFVDGIPRAVALIAKAKNGENREWLLPDGEAPAILPASRPPAGTRNVTLSLRSGRELPVEEPSLIAEITAGDLHYRFQIFAGSPSVTCQLLGSPIGTNEASAGATVDTSGIERDGAARVTQGCDVLEHFIFNAYHAQLIQVTLQDRTDGCDNLVHTAEYRLAINEPLTLKGCLFCVEDPLSRSGVILLKHAPLPHARPLPDAVDLRTWHSSSVTPGRFGLALHGHGAAPGWAGYAWSVICYHDGAAGRTAALQRLQRQFRTYVPGRDGRFLSNTWGDRNRDGRISAAFMAEEIAAAGSIGVDVVQIDDGWQRGVSANSVVAAQKGGVWQGFWAADDHFWDAHPQRFPAGVGPTIASAKQRGLEFGLWFAPDSADDFRNWERDADTIIGFWRDHGVTAIKIDGVKAHSKIGEANLMRFFAKVQRTSNGAVVFDLDVTAEIRPGYFGAMGVGPLFVENRYSDWHRWWPHATLRNLWQLAHWVDPVRLRMEFLNTARNAAQYLGDPLGPEKYRADWLFASVMIGCPLGWFEISSLPAEYTAQVAPLVAVWKQHRAALHQGSIVPVGECPDGANWSGFLSLSADGASAHLIAFRGLTSDDRTTLNLPLPAGQPASTWRATTLAGAGSWDAVRGLSIPQALGYVWLTLARES
jgi:alpha-galactosidase